MYHLYFVKAIVNRTSSIYLRGISTQYLTKNLYSILVCVFFLYVRVWECASLRVRLRLYVYVFWLRETVLRLCVCVCMGIREFLSARHMSLSVCLANPPISTYFLAAYPLSVIVSLPSYPTHKSMRVYLSLHLSVSVIVSLLSYPTDKCVRVCASTQWACVSHFLSTKLSHR